MTLIAMFLSWWATIWNMFSAITIDGIPYTALLVAFTVVSALLGFVLANFSHRG